MRSVRSLLLVLALLAFGSELCAQRVVVREGPRHRRARAVVVVRSPYRPARVVVYHPYWGPRYAFHRRWIFFPRYNIYWDNWRNQYVFWNGSVWVSQVAVPRVIVNVNLAKERSIELNENEDDMDDIYRSNNSHKSTYPGS